MNAKHLNSPSIFKLLSADAKFFIPLGFFCGFVQVIGYKWFHKASWGTELLAEHISFNSMLILFSFALGLEVLQRLLQKCLNQECFTQLIATSWDKVAQLATAAGLIVAGFSIVPLILGDLRTALTAGFFSLYCLAIIVLAHGIRKHGEAVFDTTSFWLAVGYVIGIPFSNTH